MKKAGRKAGWLVAVLGILATAVCSVLLVIMVMSFFDIVPAHRNIEKADVNHTFEEDYAELAEVSEYLLSLEDDLIVIRSGYLPMTVDFDDEVPIDNWKIKNTIRHLFFKGYSYISKSGGTIKFERWEKSFSYEFRAGFAFNSYGGEGLGIQFLMKQEELSRENWYYFEEDYNEWRSGH